ncbi:hypothetical protein GOODEAATRI_030122, partial [Goodea atripinnis]
ALHEMCSVMGAEGHCHPSSRDQKQAERTPRPRKPAVPQSTEDMAARHRDTMHPLRGQQKRSLDRVPVAMEKRTTKNQGRQPTNPRQAPVTQACVKCGIHSSTV